MEKAMPKLNRYRVVRKHYGDKAYAVGDIRDAAEADVKHLVPNVLELVGPVPDENEAPAEKAKAEDTPLNKAEPAAPANKAARQRASKGK
jgi:hypothetical protein